MSGDSHIDKRTPEEMYKQAYERIIFIGNAINDVRPPWNLKNHSETGQYYHFAWDKLSKYDYTHSSQDGFYHYFRRVSDGGLLTITKYTERPPQIR